MLVLHARTADALKQCITQPPHALIMTGPPGSGKSSLAYYYAAQLLNTTVDQLKQQPYFRHIAPEKTEAITIEQIRQLQSFLTLKVPRQGEVTRVVMIENAHVLTIEAQNALLKTLEEPPTGTVLVLTASQAQALLPTIRSRAHSMSVATPLVADLVFHFTEAGYDEAAVKKALLVSGGLPGLTAAIVKDESDHPLLSAVTTAREILQKSRFERLAMVDGLAKQKAQCQNVLFVLQQMADAALPSAATAAAGKRWANVLKVSYQAGERLSGNSQTKLVLTDLMLNL